MLPHDLAVLPELDPLGIGADFYWPTDGATIHGVAVRQEKGPLDLFLFFLTVEADETGRRAPRNWSSGPIQP